MPRFNHETHEQFSTTFPKEIVKLLREQSKKLFGEENITGYIKLIASLDAQAGIVKMLQENKNK